MSDYLDSDEHLIGYCEIHCQTERALFASKHINRMLELAGHPPGWTYSVPDGQFHSMTDTMEELCRMARARLKKLSGPPPNNVISLAEFRSKNK